MGMLAALHRTYHVSRLGQAATRLAVALCAALPHLHLDAHSPFDSVSRRGRVYLLLCLEGSNLWRCQKATARTSGPPAGMFVTRLVQIGLCRE